MRDNIAEQVQEMLENDIIRVSKSPLASDVVLVRKKDGQMRFAVDYRKLNDVTKKDAYAIPNPQSILDQLDGSRVFSCMDVAAAYWCYKEKNKLKRNLPFILLGGNLSLKSFHLVSAIHRRLFRG